MLEKVTTDHEITSLGNDPLTAVCSCGWSAESAYSPQYAARRARIHLSEMRTTALVQRIQLVTAQAQQRADELAEIRATSVWRRQALVRERLELRAMRDRWATWAPGRVRSAAQLLDTARQLASLDLSQLWLDYVALGGNCPRAELAALLSGEQPMRQLDYEIIAAALNERFANAGFGYPVDEDRNVQ
ncbi:MAG TPA: hypothetical protein VGI00_12420 [Streptosporangiaceae bacterium]